MLRTGEKATGMIERSQGNIYGETNFENSTWRTPALKELAEAGPGNERD